MEPTQRWTPNDWLRLIGLAGGFGLFVLGTKMVYQGISTEGHVDLKSVVLSGTLRTTSAGIYICFFALFIIVFVLATLLTPPKPSQAHSIGRAHRLKSVFWGLLAGIGACGLGAAYLPEGFRTVSSIALGVLAMCLVSVVTAMIRMTYDDGA